MEGDGDEEDEEGRADGDGERHADEDAVEEDAGFEEEALQQHFLLELVRGERGCGVGVGGLGRSLGGWVKLVEIEIGVIVGVCGGVEVAVGDV